ncbi:DNA helicase PcrA [Moorella naiadis]|uniref:DNA helicase PcrA n=1 Tax=Moorella naiadis (nom. illeg.) TaxID=3093670 RepID=UPI003D9CB399
MKVLADFMSLLNDPQQEAVKHRGTPLLVLAGAGSGKTRVLTYRVASLIQEGVRPENILAVTFTNKAAGEMKERLAGLVGEAVRGLQVSTFHSACVRILRREAHLLGYRPNFVIYDTDDQQAVLKGALKELNLDEKKYPPRSLAAVINSAKNDLQTPERFLDRAATFREQQQGQVYRRYQEQLRDLNAMDFDDLIMQTVFLWQQNPLVLRYYQQRWQHILVDEYQDTNHAQYLLVRLLAGKGDNLCVVGDPDQGIYGWRGADIGNILAFEEDFPRARVILLEENYRSTRPILQAANTVIQHNEGRREKRLWTRRQEGELLYIYRAADERDEGSFIAGEVYRRHQEEGRPFNDFAVLYRTHAQSRALEEAFLQAGVPYEIIGGLKFYQRKEIKDILAYLRVIANPDDSISLLRIINVPRRGIGDITLSRLETAAAVEGSSLYGILTRVDTVAGLPARGRQALQELVQLLDNLRRQQEELTVTDLVTAILKETGYQAELEAEKTPEAQARLENLKEFQTVTRSYDQGTPEPNLGDFLTQVALVAESDTYTGTGGVALMTMHTAKGLEFPVVFLAGLEEGVFPHFRSLDDPAEMEEERRLCYVGMTRAREVLYLTHAWTRNLYGSTMSNPPSRFLDEVPADLIQDTGTGSLYAALPGKGEERQERSGWQRGPARSRTAPPRKTGGAWQVGDKVQHNSWGVGVVVKISGTGDDTIISVAFPERGIKQLAVAYAPVRKV